MATIIYGQDYTEEDVQSGAKLRDHQTELRNNRNYLYSKWKAFFDIFVEEVSPEESLEFARMCYNELYDKVIARETWGMGSNSNGAKWKAVAVAHEDAY